jgi:hypothetical protein
MLAAGTLPGRPKARLHRFSIIQAAKGIDPLPPHFSSSAAKRKERSLLLGVAVLVVLVLVLVVLVLEDLLQGGVMAEGLVLLLLLAGWRPPWSSSPLSSCGMPSCVCGWKECGGWWVGRLAHDS